MTRRLMNRGTAWTIASVLGLAVAAAPLAAIDDAPAKPKAADEAAKETDKDKTEKPIKSLKDLMERMQKQSSETFQKIRGRGGEGLGGETGGLPPPKPGEDRAKDGPTALAALKKADGYAGEIEKWIPAKIAADEAKKKKFLENVAALRKANSEALKLLGERDFAKASAEYAKATATCQTCHNEFRPKKK